MIIAAGNALVVDVATVVFFQDREVEALIYGQDFFVKPLMRWRPLV